MDSDEGEQAATAVEVWTDGGCKPNPGPGGWAAILRYGGTERVVSYNLQKNFDGAVSMGPCIAVGETDQRDGAQRVSRWAVWLWQRGQNFFNSRRSGSLRRFFLVM